MSNFFTILQYQHLVNIELNVMVQCHSQYFIYVWRLADHPAIWVVPARGFAAFLGNFVLTRFGCTASEARHLFFRCYIIHGTVMSWRCTCTGHVTFYYKRSAGASFGALLALFGSFGSWFVLQVCPCHPHMAGV